MHNLRNNMPKILELERQGKDVIKELGEHIISKEVLKKEELERNNDMNRISQSSLNIRTISPNSLT